MFLIRTAFWLSLIVLVLPTDAQQQQRLYTTASQAALHAATFCDRNQGVCAKGQQFWGIFQQKLEFGGRMAINLASERMFGSPSRSVTTAAQPVKDTLSPADLQPPWRRPVRTGA